MCTSFSKPRGCNWKVTWRLQGEYFLMFELQSDQPSLRLQSNMSPVLVEYKSHCACLLSQSCRVYFFFFFSLFKLISFACINQWECAFGGIDV